MSRALPIALVLALAASCAATPEPGTNEPRLVSFSTPDGGIVYADEYGAGAHAVVLVHGGRFDKASWAPQARELEAAGFRVLSIDLRGYGRSRGGTPSDDPYEGLYLDVLGAVDHVQRTGAETVSVVGGSMGGWAAADAAVVAEPGTIDRLVLFASSSVDEPERMQGRKLFLCARDDPYADGSPRLVDVRAQYERAPGPKELVVLDGAAHAQHVFATPQGERALAEILRFLSAP